jgi:hypothetical protein
MQSDPLVAAAKLVIFCEFMLSGVDPMMTSDNAAAMFEVLSVEFVI